MITDSFDNASPAIISRQAIYGPQKHLCDICIVTFSLNIMNTVLKRFKCQEIAKIRICNGDIPIYSFEYKGLTIAVYLSGIGAALAGTFIAEANWLVGASKFIVFGSAGSLDAEATSGKFVLPSAAYRDEGTSYHYAPPADYIEISNAPFLANIFDALNLPYVIGKCWTTDAFYRETQAQFQQRVTEGCIAVDMELAGLQAVCNFYNLQLFPFLMTGDILDSNAYDIAQLDKANHEFSNFLIALEIAEKVGKTTE